MALNGISTDTAGTAIDTKMLRRNEKLSLAQAKRSTLGIPGYRPLNILAETHNAYVNGAGGATLTELSGSTSPEGGHPWTLDPTWDKTSGIGAGAVLTGGLPAGTITYLEMNNGIEDLGNIEDSTAQFISNGFILNDPVNNGSAVIFVNLSTANDSLFDTSAYKSGYVWNVTWGPDSTYPTTPVAMYYAGAGPETLLFWILDPTDLTYSTPVSPGTFTFPAVFTEGTTPTSFSN